MDLNGQCFIFSFLGIFQEKGCLIYLSIKDGAWVVGLETMVSLYTESTSSQSQDGSRWIHKVEKAVS